MGDIKLITQQNIPCWYEISFLETAGPSIVLRLHKDFIKKPVANLADSFLIKAFKDDFKLEDFLSDFGGDIGFGGVLKSFDKKGDFVEFIARIPKVKKNTGTCKECKGTGKHEELGISCGYCRGTGIGYIIDTDTIYAISASFTIVLSLLSLWGYEGTTSSSLTQLLTLTTKTGHGDHGGSLWGEISIPLAKWIESIGEEVELPEMIHAMKTTHEFMMGPENFPEYYFRARSARDGRFVSDCPGDACGLHPADWYKREDHGYEFGCHNVDTPIQQLTLLAGLAALHDSARKEIKI